MSTSMSSGSDEIVRGVLQSVQVTAVIPAQPGGCGDEHLQRHVAGTDAHACQRGVDAVCAVLDRGDRTGHAQ